MAFVPHNICQCGVVPGYRIPTTRPDQPVTPPRRCTAFYEKQPDKTHPGSSDGNAHRCHYSEASGLWFWNDQCPQWPGTADTRDVEPSHSILYHDRSECATKARPVAIAILAFGALGFVASLFMIGKND